MTAKKNITALKLVSDDFGVQDIPDIQYDGFVKIERAKNCCNDDIHFLNALAFSARKSLDVASFPKVYHDDLRMIDFQHNYIRAEVMKMNERHAEGNGPTEQDVSSLQKVVNSELELFRKILRFPL